MIYTDGTHVITDQADLAELHNFAASALGFPRRWFQDKPDRPHYDTITKGKKLAAIKGGAKLVSGKEIINILKGRAGK